jgi:NAD(P)-dependent dehydrogenase (short-subunit alcohol dehydrogenase family)
VIDDERTQALLEHNAKVYIAARSKSKATAAIEELKQVTGREAIFLKLDLADLRQVKQAAEEFMRYAVFGEICSSANWFF